jgi:integrase
VTRRRGPNEGSIYRRSDGRWVGELHLGYRDGKRARKQFYGSTRREVSERLAQARRDLDRGIIPASDRQTFGQYLEIWLAEAVRPAVRPKTFLSYSTIVRLHVAPELGRTPMSRLSPQQIQRLLNRKFEAGLSPRTVGMVFEVIRNALNRAVRWGLVGHNAASAASPPRYVRPEMKSLDEEQARRLLAAAAGHRLQALFGVALGLGLRQGEALGLKWGDVDFGSSALMVRRSLQRVNGDLIFSEPKTARSQRVVQMPATVTELLRAHRLRQLAERLEAGSRWSDQDLVFATRAGRPLDARNVLRAFALVLRRGDLPAIRFHDLRHSCATILLSQGVPPRVVMDILGHSQIGLTMNTYAHVIPALRDDAAAKMERALTARV